MPSSEPTQEQLQARLTRLLPFVGKFMETVYRSSTPEYATGTDLLTGEGSRIEGGRWNPIGVASVYASLTPETAMAEALAHHRYYGLAVEDAMPRTFVAIEARLQAVLDLRRGEVRRKLQVSEERMLTVDWRRIAKARGEPITQAIGRAASEVGLEGLVIPSAADPSGQNLIAFPRRFRHGSNLRVLHVDRLPK